MKKIAAIGIVFAFFISPAFSLTEASVQRVIDGDTIELTDGTRVRLIGIDAPEQGQPGADAAAQFVQERTANRTIWLEADGNDRDAHGRLRRYVWLQQPANPGDVNQIRRYQLNALLLSYGLANVMIIGNVRNAELFRQLVPVAQERFIGNRNSLIFHTARCTSLPGSQNRIYFESREAAIRAGHRACNRCMP